MAKITYERHKKNKRIKKKKQTEQQKGYDQIIYEQQNPHMVWFNNFSERQDIIKQLHELYKSNCSHRHCLGLLLDTSFKTVINNKILYLCRKCNNKYESSQRVTIHYNRKHGKTPTEKIRTEKKELYCEPCDKKFACMANKLRHDGLNNCKRYCDVCLSNRTKKLRDCEEHYVCDSCWSRHEQCTVCVIDKE